MSQSFSERMRELGAKRRSVREGAAARFMSYTRQVGECWEWLGTTRVTPSGHKLLMFSLPDGKGRYLPIAARKLSWESFRETPAPRFIEETCGNSLCVNPDHLRKRPQKRRSSGTGAPPLRMTPHLPAIIKDLKEVQRIKREEAKARVVYQRAKRQAKEKNYATLASKYGMTLSGIRAVAIREGLHVPRNYWRALKVEGS